MLPLADQWTIGLSRGRGSVASCPVTTTMTNHRTMPPPTMCLGECSTALGLFSSSPTSSTRFVQASPADVHLIAHHRRLQVHEYCRSLWQSWSCAHQTCFSIVPLISMTSSSLPRQDPLFCIHHRLQLPSTWPIAENAANPKHFRHPHTAPTPRSASTIAIAVTITTTKDITTTVRCQPRVHGGATTC